MNKKSASQNFDETDCYASNVFAFSILEGTTIVNASVSGMDTVKFASAYFPANQFLMESTADGTDAQVYAAAELKTGTYTITRDVVLSNAIGSREIIKTTTGSEQITRRITFTVKIVDAMPKVTVKAPKLNSFIKNNSTPIELTIGDGARADNIALLNNRVESFTQNFNVIRDEDGRWMLALSDNVYNKSGNAGYLEVTLVNYPQPVLVPVTVSVSSTAPILITGNENFTVTDKELVFTVVDKATGQKIVGITSITLDGEKKNNTMVESVTVDGDDVITLAFKNNAALLASKTYTAQLLVQTDSWNGTAPLLASVKVPNAG